MQFKQLAAIFEILAFLGTLGALAAAGVAFAGIYAVGEERLARSVPIISGWLFGGRGLARKAFATAAILIAGYAMVLFGASVLSNELTLAPGEEKYFCEIDCHLAYSVADTATAKTVGSGAGQVTAQGMFYIVNVRTRFDENTISPHRGNAPLDPSPRLVTLVDEEGQRYVVSADAEAALTAAHGAGTPLTQPLRPGESYTTRLVFDLPPGTRNPRLLIESPVEPDWLGRVLIGDEGSLFHKKVFLRLPA
ncbi:MAG TPA: hypothetical protein VG033_00350 [Candidatus Acidoferrales bacterium]|jgi:hypothetical protein|nr:hypothetical protein [Candidatus Acidoferrales bacterium]